MSFSVIAVFFPEKVYAKESISAKTQENALLEMGPELYDRPDTELTYRRRGDENMCKKKVVLLITAVMAYMMTILTIVWAGEVKGKEKLPFTFEKTDYGVAKDSVVANKLVITDENAHMLWGTEESISRRGEGYGFDFIVQDIDKNTSKFTW